MSLKRGRLLVSYLSCVIFHIPIQHLNWVLYTLEGVFDFINSSGTGVHKGSDVTQICLISWICGCKEDSLQKRKTCITKLGFRVIWWVEGNLLYSLFSTSSYAP